MIEEFQVNSQTIPTYLNQTKEPNFKEISSDFKTCPTQGCNYVFIMNDTEKHFKCEKCHKQYCLQCNSLFHKNQTCVEYQKELLTKKFF